MQKNAKKPTQPQSFTFVYLDINTIAVIKQIPVCIVQSCVCGIQIRYRNINLVFDYISL